jgi:hypothetical protein
MHRHIVAAVAAGLMTLGSVVARAAVTAGTDLTIRVYDGSGLPPATVRAALAHAGAAFEPAAIAIVWLPCGAAGDAHHRRCGEPPRPGELILRLVAAAPSSSVRARLPLGDAMVDRRTGAGVLSTVYVDRVAALARAGDADLATVLGRTIAHELGHLLLATTRHASHGLMRPLWTPEEVRRGRTADWAFAPRELAALRARRRASA